MPNYYYHHQHGSGLPVFRGGVMQKGYGLGGLFKGMLRTVTPHLKRGLAEVGKQVLKNGVRVMEDVAKGENFKSAAKKRAKEGVDDVINSVINKKAKKSNKTVSRKQASKGRGRKKQADTLGVL